MLMNNNISSESLGIDKQLHFYVKRLYSLLTSYKVVMTKNGTRSSQFTITTNIISTVLTGYPKLPEDTFSILEKCKPIFQRLYENKQINLTFVQMEMIDNDRVLFHVKSN